MAVKEYKGIVMQKTMEEVMHSSMIPYSEHVILDRALPRVEDGLKPVQRRILYSLHELGITPDKPYRKSARIVGDCLGKYHPHGDKSVYDAMVRMAQPHNMRHMLVDGHGNFGSIDGDSAAAMRYTEARMAPLAMELLRDLDKNTVKWSLNFDDTTKEPDMLPGRYPNLLVNGASGIAVGLATNIPPHNLAEVIDGVIAYIDNPKITLAAMMKYIKGPDFPSGGYIIAGEELIKAYETGKGKVTMRAKIHIELDDNDRKNIVIDELPYQVNKANLLEAILNQREAKKGALSYISEICDESDRNGMRAVIRVKKDGDPREICELLFKHTQLSQNFGINMVAIADGKPQLMGLMDIIAYYVNYQREVIVRRTKYELDEAKEREHILDGLLVAVKNIDEVIKIIKSSSSTSEARVKLRSTFDLSDRQAQAILDMRLARLTQMEVYKLEKEINELRELIGRLEKILASKKEQMAVVAAELLAIKKMYKEPRRAIMLASEDNYRIPSDADAKPIENYVIGYNAAGALKRMSLKSYAMAVKEYSEKTGRNDLYTCLISAQSNDVIYCFTNLGNCFKVDADCVPESKWRDKCQTVNTVVPEMAESERIVRLAAIKDGALPKGSVLFYTKEGMIKKSPWSEYGVVKSAFQAVKLKEGDEVIGIEDEQDYKSLMFVTAQGMVLNAEMNDIPSQGRVSGGVKGILLNDGDYVVRVTQVGRKGLMCIVSDKSYSKRVEVSEVDVSGRYRKGVKIIDFKEPSSKLVAAFYVDEASEEDVVLLDSDNYFSAFCFKDIATESRTSKGRPLCKLRSDVYINEAFVYLTLGQ